MHKLWIRGDLVKTIWKKNENGTMCSQVCNQDIIWGAANAKVDETTEMYFYCLICLFRNVAINEKL